VRTNGGGAGLRYLFHCDFGFDHPASHKLQLDGRSETVREMRNKCKPYGLKRGANFGVAVPLISPSGPSAATCRGSRGNSLCLMRRGYWDVKDGANVDAEDRDLHSISQRGAFNRAGDD